MKSQLLTRNHSKDSVTGGLWGPLSLIEWPVRLGQEIYSRFPSLYWIQISRVSWCNSETYGHKISLVQRLTQIISLRRVSIRVVYRPKYKGPFSMSIGNVHTHAVSILHRIPHACKQHEEEAGTGIIVENLEKWNADTKQKRPK